MVTISLADPESVCMNLLKNNSAPRTATLALFGLSLCVRAAAPTPEQLEFFEKKIRPVLVESCYKCHSQGEKVKGGLLVDARDGLLKGGDTGPAIVPNNPDASLLIKAI